MTASVRTGDEFAIVTDHDDHTRACLLHIGSPHVDEVRAMTERLADLPVRVRDCTNVYQGLARLCIADADKPTALVVSVDAMDAAELDFFRIVARLFPALPVYVYGGARSCARIDRAIELGARDRASAEVLNELGRFRRSSSGRTFGVEAAKEAEPTDAKSEASPAATSRPEHDESVDPREVSVAPDEDPVVADLAEEIAAEDVGEVRVPWLTYQDAPVRRAPDRPPRHSPPAIAPAPEKRIVRAAEPLLSDEELRALLEGDDGPLTDSPNGSAKDTRS